jgi:hypothetical protein
MEGCEEGDVIHGHRISAKERKLNAIGKIWRKRRFSDDTFQHL